MSNKMEEWATEANSYGPKRLNANWPPKKGRNNKVSLLLDEDEYTKLYLSAERADTPMSWILRRLIKQLNPDDFGRES